MKMLSGVMSIVFRKWMVLSFTRPVMNPKEVFYRSLGSALGW